MEQTKNSLRQHFQDEINEIANAAYIKVNKTFFHLIFFSILKLFGWKLKANKYVDPDYYRYQNSFICPHCYKSIVLKQLIFTCPNCHFKYDNFDFNNELYWTMFTKWGDVRISRLKHALFYYCENCRTAINAIACPFCSKQIDFNEDYWWEVYESRRRAHDYTIHR